MRNVSFSSQALKNGDRNFKDKRGFNEDKGYFHPVLKPNHTGHKHLQKDATLKTAKAYIPKMIENEHFRSVLMSKPTYNKYLANLHQPNKSVHIEDVMEKIDEREMTLQEQLTFLQDLGSLSFESKKNFICDKRVLSILHNFRHILPSLSHKQFVLSMKSFGSFEFRNFESHMSYDLKSLVNWISNGYEHECIKRAHSWDIQTLLIAADLFYTLKAKYFLNFSYLSVFWQRIETLLKEEKSNRHEVITLLFHANLGRRTSWGMRDLLMDVFADGIPEEFSVDECAIVCAGFHKTNHPINSRKFILDTILRIKQNAHEVNEISICAIFKAFSRTFDKGLSSANPEIFAALNDLSDNIAHEFDRLSYIGFIRVIKFYHDVLLSGTKLEIAFINRVKHMDFNTVRSKEWSKTSFLLGSLLLDFDGHKDVLKKIERHYLQDYMAKMGDDEHDLHNIVRCLSGMSYLNYYPEDLVEKCFSKEILQDLENFERLRKDTKSMLYQIQESMKIERPNYKGKLLSDTVYHKIQQEMNIIRPKLNFTVAKSDREKMLKDIKSQLRKMFGGLFHISYVLPHFDLADIEMYFDDFKGPVQRKHSTSDCKRIVICVHAKNSYYRVKQDDGSFILKLGGRYNIRQRQLERIADVVIPISEIDYEAVEDKRKYLTELLPEKLKLKCVKRKEQNSQMLLDLLHSRKMKKQKLN